MPNGGCEDLPLQLLDDLPHNASQNMQLRKACGRDEFLVVLTIKKGFNISISILEQESKTISFLTPCH